MRECAMDSTQWQGRNKQNSAFKKAGVLALITNKVGFSEAD